MMKLLTTAGEFLGGFSPTKLAIAVVVAGTVALTLTSIYGVWHHQVYQSGYDRAVLDVARADSKALDRASSMRNAWVECRDAKRSWDQTTGKCK